MVIWPPFKEEIFTAGVIFFYKKKKKLKVESDSRSIKLAGLIGHVTHDELIIKQYNY